MDGLGFVASAVVDPDGGIPLPFGEEQEGLPCEESLLGAASSRPIHNYKLNKPEGFVETNLSPGPIVQLAARIAVEASSLKIARNSVLALDIGSASCGFALLHDDRIVFSGVRLFAPAGLDHKNHSRQRHRRQVRATRVRLRRHRQRRAAVRQVLISSGLPDPLAVTQTADPYAWRAEGLDRLLLPSQWSAVLYQIAKRRGSDSGAEGNSSLELDGYRTIGELLAKGEAYGRQKRNRSGSYLSSFSAALYRDEVAALFAAQRAAGNPSAGHVFEAAYKECVFSARGHSDGEARVGACPFLPTLRRGARHSPAVERYLFLDALTKLRVTAGSQVRRLTAAELAMADARFGAIPSVTFNDLRAWLGWDASVRPIREIADDADLVTPVGAAAGTCALRSAIGPAPLESGAIGPGQLDAIMAILTFRNTIARIKDSLRGLNLPPETVERLLHAYREGAFVNLKGAASLSVAAAAAMTPHLAGGDLFHDAAIAAGFDPLAREAAILHTIQNPCVVRAVRESLRQVQAAVQEFGFRPERIHIETAEDLGVGGQRRAEIAAARAAAARRWEAAKVAVAGIIPVANIRSHHVQRYLLWQEQQGRCIYSGEPISIRQLLDGSVIQVDHILPRLRSGDNGWQNRVVCFARENQEKGERTPFEWRGGDAAWWAQFQARVEASQLSAQKRRKLLSRYFAEREGRVLQRNLNDTRYAARCVLAALRGLYPDGQPQLHLVARPGHLTALLRRTWGFEKDRDDPRHHALDAIVLAAAGPKTMRALYRGFDNGRGEAAAAPLPWPEFQADVARALADMVPSRSEIRRARGQAHGMTVRRARTAPSGGACVYERRPVWKLRLNDLERIPDPEANQPMIRLLREWIEAGKPADAPPISPSGAQIRRVRLLVSGSTGIPREGLCVRGGVAAFGDIVRLDIYSCEGRYFPVPVNRTDIARRKRPPVKAIVPGKLREEWPEVGDQHSFCFSVYHGSFVEVVTQRGVTKSGFVRSFDSYKSQFFLTPVHNSADIVKVGISSAVSIRKHAVDRMGRVTPVHREALTWRGRTIVPASSNTPTEEGTSLREVA